MTLYAHKQNVVSVVQLTEDVELNTISGLQYGLKGDYLATDEYFNKYIIPRAYFEKHYIGVVKQPIDKLQMARGYVEMGAINLEEAEAGRYTYNEGLGMNKAF